MNGSGSSARTDVTASASARPRTKRWREGNNGDDTRERRLKKPLLYLQTGPARYRNAGYQRRRQSVASTGKSCV